MSFDRPLIVGITGKIIATVVGIALQLLIGFFLIGVATSELGAPTGVTFPYGPFQITLLLPLFVAIWAQAPSLARRLLGWLVGIVFTMTAAVVLRAVGLHTVSFPWGAAASVLLPLIVGGLTCWAIVRMK